MHGMGMLYDVLRERVGLSPMQSLAWIYGPKDLPASRLPNFMDERRRQVAAKAAQDHARPDADRREE